MGHTLVARFDDGAVEGFLPEAELRRCNKIPFGRDCDRGEADEVLPYHMTLMHWAKKDDPVFLPKLSDLRPPAAEIVVTGVLCFPAEEGSMLAALEVGPGRGFRRLTEYLEEAVGMAASAFPHITLAADRDHRFIRSLCEYVRNSSRFPITLEIRRLELYKIWKPVRLARVFAVDGE